LSGQVSASPFRFQTVQRKKKRGQCLTLTALKPCLAAPYRAFAGHCRAYRATPRLYWDATRLIGPRKYYYGLLATKFRSMWRCRHKRPVAEKQMPAYKIRTREHESQFKEPLFSFFCSFFSVFIGCLSKIS
jgi:hypothetical protein